jgi:HEAT repeat protein
LLLSLAGGLPGTAVCQDAADPGARDVPDLLQRLERIEQESRDATGRSTGARTDRLAVLFEQSHIATGSLGGQEQSRYFVTRAILINLSDERLTLVTDDLVLLADGEEFRLSTLHEQLRTGTVNTGREFIRFQDVAPPEELRLPPGGTAAVWLMYSGLPAAPRVPAMTFRTRVGDRNLEIDVNEYQRGVLGLREERLGPDACLALLTVSGELNSINAADFADELDRLGQQGVARAVVSWSETTAPLSQDIGRWLRSAVLSQRNGGNPQLPVLPASIAELHFVAAPGRNNVLNANGVTIHADRTSAVLAALQTACAAIPRDQLRRQVVSGSPLARAAALTHGGSRLASEDLPLVLRSLNDPEESVRRGAIAALACFSDPGALDALVSTVHGDSADLSRAALEALASSRFPAAHARVLEYLAAAPLDARAGIIDVLSRFPRPEWSDVLYEFTTDEDPQIRLAALRALVRVGHVELLSVLTDALHDEDQATRDFAFARLVESADSASEDAAMEFALTTLESQPPDAAVNQLLSRTRDQRAIPLLLRHLDHPGDHREQVIHLLARVAGDAAIEMLVDRFEGFDQNEQEHALGVLQELQAPQAREFAIAAIRGGQSHLMPQATRILAVEPGPESVEMLAGLLRSEEQQNWSVVCNALKMIGTRDARLVLLEARESDNPAKRTAAATALRQLARESPARYVIDLAKQQMQEEKFEEAEKLLTLAVQFDDESARAYAHRGFVRLRLERVSEAQLDFEQAAAIDPFNSQAVTGLAVARTLQGAVLEGIRIIRENAAKFPRDPLYDYNSACVYGLALKQVAESDTTDEHQPHIQDYRTEAIRLLRRSIELEQELTRVDPELESLSELIRTDPDLDSLRELDEFQTLLQEFAENSEEPDTDVPDPDSGE